jgi:transcriptional regulator with XRE-family HTH domain
MIAVTGKESQIWSFRFKGFSGSEIARRLGITRQAISKTLKNVDAKILQTLNENARMMGLAVTSVDPEKGILLGYHPQTKTKTMVFYLPGSGVQAWFRHEGECEGCITWERCMKVLREAAEFWDVPFEEGEKPTEIAERLFEKVWK